MSDLRIKRYRKRIEELENENEELKSLLKTYDEKSFTKLVDETLKMKKEYDELIKENLEIRKKYEDLVKEQKELNNEYKNVFHRIVRDF